MDLLEHLRRQFVYDAWANREVLSGLRASPHPPTRSLQLLAHILSAERLWLERIRRQPQSLPVWPDFSPEQCEAQVTDIQRLWRQFLSQLSRGTRREGRLQEQQGRTVDQHRGRRFDARVAALRVSSRTNRQPRAREWRN